MKNDYSVKIALLERSTRDLLKRIIPVRNSLIPHSLVREKIQLVRRCQYLIRNNSEN